MITPDFAEGVLFISRLAVSFTEKTAYSFFQTPESQSKERNAFYKGISAIVQDKIEVNSPYGEVFYSSLLMVIDDAYQESEQTNLPVRALPLSFHFYHAWNKARTGENSRSPSEFRNGVVFAASMISNFQNELVDYVDIRARCENDFNPSAFKPEDVAYYNNMIMEQFCLSLKDVITTPEKLVKMWEIEKPQPWGFEGRIRTGLYCKLSNVPERLPYTMGANYITCQPWESAWEKTNHTFEHQPS